MRFGLIGESLSHSHSSRIHNELAGYRYDLLETDLKNLEKTIRDVRYSGFNITIPYKEEAYKLCDQLSHVAKRLGNVNTIVKVDDELYGYNTDYGGLKTSLRKNKVEVAGKKVLILGNGSAANTVKILMEDKGASEIVKISRSGEVKFDEIADYYDFEIIVNATPVGMYPNNGESLIDIEPFENLETIIDVIYNPYYTKLLLDGMEKGVKVINGLEMLIYQASKTAEFFLGREISEKTTEEYIKKFKKELLNIAIIGMPGIGKTTLAEKLAKDMRRKVVSIDKLIEEKMGKTPEEIILEDGEKAFREIETEILKKYSKESRMILDCGGGIVTREENYPLLKQNSKIIWLKGDIKDLTTKDRPLSQEIGLEELYKKREPLYEKWADEIGTDENGFKRD